MSVSFIENYSYGDCLTRKDSLFFGNILHIIFKVNLPGRVCITSCFPVPLPPIHVIGLAGGGAHSINPIVTEKI